VTMGQYFSGTRFFSREPAKPITLRLRVLRDPSRFPCPTCKGNPKPLPVIVPPTWHKEDYHRQISSVWATAAKELRDVENVFVIGYSLPNSDSFFRYLYGLGTVGKATLKRFHVFNPDESGEVEGRFRNILGTAALARFRYYRMDFRNAIDHIRQDLAVPKGPTVSLPDDRRLVY